MTSAMPDSYRRNENARRAILDAAISAAVELGYEKVSIEGIAKRAGVGKQTIYRWWTSKGAVLLEALQASTAQPFELPDTGDIVADLRSELSRVAEFFESSMGAVYLSVLMATRTDPSLDQVHHEQLVLPGIEAFRRRLAAAGEQGQVRADVDAGTLYDMLYGALLHRVLFQTRPLDQAQIDAALAIAFDGVATTG